MKHLGIREIVRRPSILRIKPDEVAVIEDKKSRAVLGIYIGSELAKEFEAFLRKKRLLEAAKKVKEASNKEFQELEGTLSDGL